MFGAKARKRRASRRDDRRANKAAKVDARRSAKAERAEARQGTRMANAAGRQDTKQGMVAAGMNPNAWVSDVSQGVVGLANAASAYGQAAQLADGMTPQGMEALGRSNIAPKEPAASPNTMMLAAAAAAAFFLLKK